MNKKTQTEKTYTNRHKEEPIGGKENRISVEQQREKGEKEADKVGKKKKESHNGRQKKKSSIEVKKKNLLFTPIGSSSNFL